MKETHRIATIFASIYTLIQAIIWCVIAIYSVAVYACQVKYPFELNQEKITISDLLYISYYYAQCKAKPGEALTEAPSATRTYYWMLIYGIISAIWIPTSVLLMVAAFNKIKGKYGAILYIPWIVNTVVIIIIDVIATVIYGLDISHTLTVEDYKKFIKPAPGMLFPLDEAHGITVVPAVEMTVYFSRAIVFWLLNFILLGIVIQGCVAMKRMSPVSAFVENEARAKATNDGSSSQWINMRTNDLYLKSLPRLQLEDSPTRTRAPYPPISPQSPISENPPISPQLSISENPPQTIQSLPSDPIAAESLQKQPSLRRSASSPVYDVNGRHLGNAMPEEIHKHIPINNAASKSGLSNQVPWSYAPTNELNLRMKQAAYQQRDVNVKPQIPLPDYTIHSQQGKRLTEQNNFSFFDSNINQYSSSPDPERSWNRRNFYY